VDFGIPRAITPEVLSDEQYMCVAWSSMFDATLISFSGHFALEWPVFTG